VAGGRGGRTSSLSFRRGRKSSLQSSFQLTQWKRILTRWKRTNRFLLVWMHSSGFCCATRATCSLHMAGESVVLRDVAGRRRDGLSAEIPMVVKAPHGSMFTNTIENEIKVLSELNSGTTCGNIPQNCAAVVILLSTFEGGR
jgi:hypothetical protein